MPTPDPSALSQPSRILQSHQLLPNHSALLVIDMQRGFLDAGASLEVPAGRALIPQIAHLMQTARRLHMPVIFTQFVYSPAVPCLRGDPFGIEHLPPAAGQPTGFGYPSGNCLIGPQASPGAESAQITAELTPNPDELVVGAHTYDKFLGTPLELALRSQQINRLLVTGVTTDICVNSTVIAAANRDFRVTVVTDGVATIEDEIQQACFKIWGRKFARLRTTAEVLAELADWGQV